METHLSSIFSDKMTKPKTKNNNYCTSYQERHFPPTGKWCKLSKKQDQGVPSSSAQLLTSSSGSDSDVPDSGVGHI